MKENYNSFICQCHGECSTTFESSRKMRSITENDFCRVLENISIYFLRVAWADSYHLETLVWIVCAVCMNLMYICVHLAPVLLVLCVIVDEISEVCLKRNFFQCGTNVHLDHRMGWFDFVATAQGPCDLLKLICSYNPTSHTTEWSDEDEFVTFCSQSSV